MDRASAEHLRDMADASNLNMTICSTIFLGAYSKCISSSSHIKSLGVDEAPPSWASLRRRL
jgi:hypothetical protein